MMSQSLGKSNKKSPKPSIETIRLEPRTDDDISFYPSSPLQKSKSDWYVNLLNDDDLIKDIENGTKPVESGNKPATFPSPEQVEVPLRHRSVRGERPKTYASQSSTKKEPLELKGVTRIEIGHDLCIKVYKKHHLRIYDGALEDVDEFGKIKQIYTNISLKKGIKTINKKELEIMDTNKTVYRLHFDSQSRAKIFTEIEKSYHTSPSSGLKNLGRFYQLRKLLKKRSSRDFLESKGIIKNEPIFGNTLEELCTAKHPVPEVVEKIVKLIEEPKNIVSEGIYRTSANLAVLQTIRCEIDLGKWDALDQYRDNVDVLTGILKLFFRELKEPLIPPQTERELRKAIIESSNTYEISDIVDRLPPPNKSTFLFIIQHLIRVCQYTEQNKMTFHNIALCWGPSMILPDKGPNVVAQTQQFTKITAELLHYYSTISTAPPMTEVTPKTDFMYDSIRRLTEIIEGKIEVEGIYRKCGFTPNIDRIMKSLENQSTTELNQNNDIHDLCCVLKKYVASLRTTIVPKEFFHRFLQICDILEDKALDEEVRRMVNELPRKDIIFLIFDHLFEVVEHEQTNKMSVNVLSDIWMTTLMAGLNAESYKRDRPKYSKLFLIFMNLNQTPASNDGGPTRTKYRSKYDNVPDDIHNYNEFHDDVTKTKL